MTRSAPLFEHPTPAGKDERYLPGEAYAAIVIPSIDIDFIVVEGTDYVSLKKGPGPLPGVGEPVGRHGPGRRSPVTARPTSIRS